LSVEVTQEQNCSHRLALSRLCRVVVMVNNYGVACSKWNGMYSPILTLLWRTVTYDFYDERDKHSL
jgi:hypothetical protein